MKPFSQLTTPESRECVDMELIMDEERESCASPPDGISPLATTSSTSPKRFNQEIKKFHKKISNFIFITTFYFL